MPGRIPPSTWGPFFWHTMHITALGYPKSPTYAEKRAAKEFFESLVHLIPCPVCRLHYAEHLKNNPVSPNLDTNEDLFRWTVKIHNLVNKDLGKKEVTELEAIGFYHSLGDLGRSPVWTPEDIDAIQFKDALRNTGIVLAVAAVAGGLYYIFSKKE
jgi:hypothetical protein